jgi:hypothetical protein
MGRIALPTFVAALLLLAQGEAAGQLSGFRTPYRYVGNVRSHLLHLIYYQHLPADSLRLNFESLDGALNAGYRKCPICFPPTPLIPGYDFERRLGMETAGVVNFYYPAPVSRAYTERLERAGRDVIAHWPFPLKGYNYSFVAIRSEEIKAFSCASGLIYLTTGLMDIIESPREMEMILAHEITHVERRHAMTEFQQQREAVYENDPVSVADRLNAFARNLVLVGYSDAHEREADFYALAYGVRRRGTDHGPLSLVLQKLKDVQWRDIRVGGGLFSGRSDIDGRMRAIAETRVVPFGPGTTFFRRGAGGQIDARIHLLFQRLRSGRLTLYATIESDETIPFNRQGNTRLVIESEGAVWSLPQEEISFIRKPPEGMEREIDHHTYVITFTMDDRDEPLPVTRGSVRRIALVRAEGLINRPPIAEFSP